MGNGFNHRNDLPGRFLSIRQEITWPWLYSAGWLQKKCGPYSSQQRKSSLHHLIMVLCNNGSFFFCLLRQWWTNIIQNAVVQPYTIPTKVFLQYFQKMEGMLEKVCVFPRRERERVLWMGLEFHTYRLLTFFGPQGWIIFKQPSDGCSGDTNASYSSHCPRYLNYPHPYARDWGSTDSILLSNDLQLDYG